MQDFCAIVNGTYTIILKDSPLSPPDVEPDYTPEAYPGQRNTGRSRTCSIEEYDFTMISSFHYVRKAETLAKAPADGSLRRGLATPTSFVPTSRASSLPSSSRIDLTFSFFLSSRT